MREPGPWLGDVLPAAAALLDVPGAYDAVGLAAAAGPASSVAVVLVDGLGADLLALSAERAPLLAAAAGGALRLHCGFPSTTPTSLVSLGTGAPAGEHGVLGFTVALPDGWGVLTHISWGDDPDPARWQPRPTWFERAAAVGVDTRAVLPAIFRGSGLSEAAYRGARFCPVDRGEDPAARLLGELDAGGRLVFGYTSVLDTAAHRFGVGSEQWLNAAAAVDAYLERVVTGLPADAVLLVTADHGGLNLDRDHVRDMARSSSLRDGVRVVAGEVRARYLHVADGAAPDVAATWRDELGADVDVFLRDEAIDAGLFGPVPPAHRSRIGDVVVISRGAAGVLASDHEPTEVSDLVGVHGGLTEAETAVPLFAFSGESRGSVRMAGTW